CNSVLLHCQQQPATTPPMAGTPRLRSAASIPISGAGEAHRKTRRKIRDLPQSPATRDVRISVPPLPSGVTVTSNSIDSPQPFVSQLSVMQAEATFPSAEISKSSDRAVNSCCTSAVEMPHGQPIFLCAM